MLHYMLMLYIRVTTIVFETECALSIVKAFDMLNFRWCW